MVRAACRRRPWYDRYVLRWAHVRRSWFQDDRGWLAKSSAVPLGRTLLDLAFPPLCLGCEGPGPLRSADLPLCDTCAEELERCEHASPARCPRCACELGAAPPHDQLCHDCRRYRHRFDQAVVLGSYDSLLRRLVLAAKHPRYSGPRQLIGRRLAAAVVRAVGDWPHLPSVVVPMPMHWLRRLARGINCPDELASRVAAAIGAPLATGLQMRRNTLLQHSLRPEQRRANVRRAFAIRRGYDFQGARVLLVDDILTTGATAGEAAAELKRGGARWVAVAAVARTAAR